MHSRSSEPERPDGAGAFLLKRNEPILLATHNSDKFAFLASRLAERGIATMHPSDLGLQPPEEPFPTFRANAAAKAKAAASSTGRVALADDGGFSIAALGGRPGVAARDWASADGDYAPAFERVGRELEAAGLDDGPAWMTTALAIAWPTGEIVAAEEATHGYLCWPPKGRGEAYEPIFALRPGGPSLAEIEAAEPRAEGRLRRAYEQRERALDTILSRLILA